MQCPSCAARWYAATKPYTKCPNNHTVRLNDKNSLRGLNVRPMVKIPPRHTGQGQPEEEGFRSAYDLYHGLAGGGVQSPQIVLARAPQVQTYFSRGREGFTWGPEPDNPPELDLPGSSTRKNMSLEGRIARFFVPGGSSLPKSCVRSLVRAVCLGGGLTFWNHVKRVSGSGWGDLRSWLVSGGAGGLFDDLRAPHNYAVSNHVYYLRGLSPFVVDQGHLPP